MSERDFLGWFAILLFAFCVGFAAGIIIDREYMKAQAVKHNAAEYDKTSGLWRWKDEVKE